MNANRHEPKREPTTDPSEPHEVVNPGDPGPTVLVPAQEEDPRSNPKLPPGVNPPPGV